MQRRSQYGFRRVNFTSEQERATRGTLGKIVKVISDKNFAFIKVPGLEEDIFVHLSNLVDKNKAPAVFEDSQKLINAQVRCFPAETNKGFHTHLAILLN